MLNIIKKKPKMNGDVLREREKATINATNNHPDPAGGTAVKISRDA